MKRTMKELAEFFDVPYTDVYAALRGIKAYGKKNQRFDTDTARQRLTDLYKRREAATMEKLAELSGRIRRVESAREAEDGKAIATGREDVTNEVYRAAGLSGVAVGEEDRSFDRVDRKSF